MTAWKALERRIALQLGGRRRGPAGSAVSDIVGVPFSVEVKRAKQSFRVAWIDQAREQGRKEGKPWLLVVARHHDRDPICVLQFSEFLTLTKQAGRSPVFNYQLEDEASA